MPLTDPQRQEIIAAIKDGSSSPDIAARFGVTLGQVAAIRAHMTMGTYSDVSGAADTEAEVANVVDAALGLANAADGAAFRLERDLQMELRENIEQLEPGLTISDEGKEQTVPLAGRIDITARDLEGTVVIELKAGVAEHGAVSQLLGYMGALMNKGERVRGILVARDFMPRAVLAARPVPTLRLVKYGYRFNFETIAHPLPPEASSG